MHYHSALKRAYTGSFTLASLVRNIKTVKSFCPVCNGALKVDIAIAYCTHKNCRFANAVPCSPVKNIRISANIRVICYTFATMVHQALYFHNP